MAGQKLLHDTSARVIASVTYQLTKMSASRGETASLEHFAKLEAALLRYNKDADEVRKVQDSLLLLQGDNAKSSELLAARLNDSSDLAATVLSKLAGAADPLGTCWPLLKAADPGSNERWVELCVRVLEAGARKGVVTLADEVVEAVTAFVKQGSKIPQLPFKKWNLAEAAGVLRSLFISASDVTPLSQNCSLYMPDIDKVLQPPIVFARMPLQFLVT